MRVRKGGARCPGTVQFSKRGRCAVVQGAVRALLVEVLPPENQLLACVDEGGEPLHVEALIA
jgi:hypothetical protein